MVRKGCRAGDSQSRNESKNYTSSSSDANDLHILYNTSAAAAGVVIVVVVVVAAVIIVVVVVVVVVVVMFVVLLVKQTCYNHSNGGNLSNENSKLSIRVFTGTVTGLL